MKMKNKYEQKKFIKLLNVKNVIKKLNLVLVRKEIIRNQLF